MRKQQLLAMALLILGSFASKQIVAKPVLHIQHWQTNNLVPVYFVKNTHLPMLDINVIFTTGSSDDGKLYGVANLTNSMLNQGAGSLTADQIANELENSGAQLGLSCNRDFSTINLRTLTKTAILNKVLTILHSLITTPTFPEKNIDTKKQQILTKISMQNQIPAGIATKEFFKKLYHHDAYAHPVIGIPSTINKINRTDLVAFFNHTYTKNRAILVLVGNITRKNAEQIANNLSAKLVQAKTLKIPTEQPQLITKATTNTIAFPTTQASIIIGCLGITHANPNYFPLLVGNHILGSGTLVSRLYKEIRNRRGLSYGIRSTFMPLKRKGPFMISLQTKVETKTQAIITSKKVLAKFINQGPSHKELQAAKQHLLGSFALSFDSNRKIAGILTIMSVYNLPLNYLDEYKNNINKVTLTKIKHAFQDVIGKQKLVTVVVG